MDKGTGKLGEDVAAAYLREKGYTILQRNYHSRYGEIDIIAGIGQYIVFAEVKTRRQGGMCDPTETVTPSKRQKIIQTALLYLMEHPEYSDCQVRFDLAAVTTGWDGRVEDFRYFENAFEGEGL